MKIYVSADMEGITGLVDPLQVEPGERDYPYARQMMMSDLTAAIEGAFEAGATEVWGNDSHECMTNLQVDQLPRGVRVIMGRNKLFSMMEGFDNTFSGVFFIGYHAKAGTPFACYTHTSSHRFQQVLINGVPAGEFLINGAVAGYFHVPVIMVSGDQAVAEEARQLSPKIETAIVKNSMGYRCTASLPREESADLIRKTAIEAVKKIGSIEPVFPQSPYTLEMVMRREVYADIILRLPNADRKDAYTVVIRDRDYLNIFKYFLASMTIAESVS